jgi:hypothetical protein
MIHQDLTFLPNLVDIETSTPTHLCFKANAKVYILEQPFVCQNVVYLLAKGYCGRSVLYAFVSITIYGYRLAKFHNYKFRCVWPLCLVGKDALLYLISKIK